MSERALEATIHGTAISLAGRGVLLRGPSGCGKSMLAAYLLDQFKGRQQEAELIADDRVVIGTRKGKLVASAPAPLAGLIEIYGVGIVDKPYCAEAEIHLAVDLVTADEIERLPTKTLTETEGCILAYLRVPQRNVVLSGLMITTVVGLHQMGRK